MANSRSQVRDNTERARLLVLRFSTGRQLREHLERINQRALERSIDKIHKSWISGVPFIRRWMLKRAIQKILAPHNRTIAISARVLDELFNSYYLTLSKIEEQINQLNDNIITEWRVKAFTEKVKRASQAFFGFQRQRILKEAIQEFLFSPTDYGLALTKNKVVNEVFNSYYSAPKTWQELDELLGRELGEFNQKKLYMEIYDLHSARNESAYYTMVRQLIEKACIPKHLNISNTVLNNLINNVIDKECKEYIVFKIPQELWNSLEFLLEAEEENEVMRILIQMVENNQSFNEVADPLVKAIEKQLGKKIYVRTTTLEMFIQQMKEKIKDEHLFAEGPSSNPPPGREEPSVEIEREPDPNLTASRDMLFPLELSPSRRGSVFPTASTEYRDRLQP